MEDQIQARLAGGQLDYAFELLAVAYQDRVFRLCYAMLYDRGLAEETAQEALLRMWKSLGRFRCESSLSTWVYAITRHACLTAVRGRRESRTVPLDLPGVRSAVERASSVIRPDRTPDVPSLIADLPDAWRQVVMLFYMQEHSYEEVASMLDLPLGTVKTYLHRARQRMAERLTESEASTMKGLDR